MLTGLHFSQLLGMMAHIPAGEIKMTHGVALVNGFDVYSELAKARQFMGYCPQYDGLIGLGTVL